MKKLSEKSFRILKVSVLLVVTMACGLYYVLFVDGDMPKTMETTSYVVKKSPIEATSEKVLLAADDEEDFIIEVEPIDDYVASESTISISQEKKDKKGRIESIVDGKININVASSEELQTLKNIGPVVASNIISYRSEYGDFGDIEDIKNVKGIGEAKFNAIKDNIYVK